MKQCNSLLSLIVVSLISKCKGLLKHQEFVFFKLSAVAAFTGVKQVSKLFKNTLIEVSKVIPLALKPETSTGGLPVGHI